MRIWRGKVCRAEADAHQQYDYEQGIKPLIEKAAGVQCAREDGETFIAFSTLSYCDSLETMARLTGGDPTKVHHLDRDPGNPVDLPLTVQMLRLHASEGAVG